MVTIRRIKTTPAIDPTTIAELVLFRPKIDKLVQKLLRCPTTSCFASDDPEEVESKGFNEGTQRMGHCFVAITPAPPPAFVVTPVD